jgi:hypothetical protein
MLEEGPYGFEGGINAKKIPPHYKDLKSYGNP